MGEFLKASYLGNYKIPEPPRRDNDEIRLWISTLEAYINGQTWLLYEAQKALDGLKVELSLMEEKDAQLDAVMASLTKRLTP